MVKAEIIESSEVSKETELIATDNVPNVDVAIEQWDAYQKLCKGLLNETDYQEIIVKSNVLATTQDYFTLKLFCYQGAGSGYQWNYYFVQRNGTV